MQVCYGCMQKKKKKKIFSFLILLWLQIAKVSTQEESLCFMAKACDIYSKCICPGATVFLIHTSDMISFEHTVKAKINTIWSLCFFLTAWNSLTNHLSAYFLIYRGASFLNFLIFWIKSHEKGLNFWMFFVVFNFYITSVMLKIIINSDHVDGEIIVHK